MSRSTALDDLAPKTAAYAALAMPCLWFFHCVVLLLRTIDRNHDGHRTVGDLWTVGVEATFLPGQVVARFIAGGGFLEVGNWYPEGVLLWALSAATYYVAALTLVIAIGLYSFLMHGFEK